MSEQIASPHNPRIAAARKLLTTRGRAAAGLFLVEGPHAVAQALASRRHAVEELFVTADATRRDVDLLRAADDADVRVTVVSDRVAAALSDTITPQGLVAVVRTEAKTTVRDVVSQRPRLVVVLVAVNDPGNVGTVIRTADAAGADAVVLADGCVDPHNSKCIRASAGSIFNLPVVRGGSIRDVAQSLHDADMTVAATTLTADRDLYDEADALSGPTAWLFGNEAHGLADDVVAAADLAVRIPIHGQAESLNLAAAAAICLYTSARLQQPNAATT